MYLGRVIGTVVSTSKNEQLVGMKLLVVDPVHIDDMQLFPRVADRSVEMRLTVANTTGKPFRGKALVTVSGNGVEVEREFPVSGDGPELRLAGELSLGDDAPLWDEFSPRLYTLRCRLLTQAGPESCEDERSVTFGLREVAQGRNHILLNGHTHIPACEEIMDMDGHTYRYLNPGSVSIPKERSAHSYMIFEDGTFYWKNMQGEEYRQWKTASRS